MSLDATFSFAFFGQPSGNGKNRSKRVKSHTVKAHQRKNGEKSSQFKNVTYYGGKQKMLEYSVD
jgi:hypothetical protein